MARVRHRFAIGFACALVLAAVAPFVAFSSQRPAATRVVNSFVSSGTGTQEVRGGGGGLIYGTLARGGMLTVKDVSKTHDLQRAVKCPPKVHSCSKNVAGSIVYHASGGKLSYKLSGTRFRAVLRGTSTVDGVGLFGSAYFAGQGTFALNGGAAQDWSTGFADLGLPNRPPSTTTTTTTPTVP
jgi:hypothetical protein